MKRVIILIAAVAFAAVSCSKNESAGIAGNQAIAFQAQAGVSTKAPAITGTTFPVTETFSVYAWTAATLTEYFMNNVTVAFDDGGTADDTSDDTWKPQGETFYWPKDATVDFIAYYPSGIEGITVKENEIKFEGIDVKTLQKDIMYSDKAVGFSNNVDLVSDAVSAYNGVPIIFRHAISKVKILAELTYNHKEEADGTVTDWTVKVNSASLSGLYTKGNCTMTLADASNPGIIGWNKPDGGVWEVTGETSTITGLSNTTVVPGTEYTAVDEIFVIPQALSAGVQKITLNLTITTKRNGVDFLSETFEKSADIYIASLNAWEINHSYTYKIMLSPTSSNGNGGNPYSDPNDPSSSVDPGNPDLSDAIITFDPAVDGWEGIDVVATISL